MVPSGRQLHILYSLLFGDTFLMTKSLKYKTNTIIVYISRKKPMLEFEPSTEY